MNNVFVANINVAINWSKLPHAGRSMMRVVFAQRCAVSKYVTMFVEPRNSSP